jgi:hypothetical protein
MNEGTGNNFCHLNNASASGGGNDTNHSAPAVSRSQQMREIQFQQNLRLDEMLMEQFRLKQIVNRERAKRVSFSLYNQYVNRYRLQQGGSYGGGQNGGDVGHYQGMSQSQPPTPMMATMSDNGAPLRSSPQQQNSREFMMPSFANSSDNNINIFHLQDSFQPERIQSPSRRGRQQQGHQQLTRSLPLMRNNNNNNLDNNTQLSQSMTQFQGHQSVEDLRADIHRRTLRLQQLQRQIEERQIDDSSMSSSLFQPASSFPSQPQRPQQQQNGLPHSFKGTSSNMKKSNTIKNNGGTSFRHSNSDPLGMTKASTSTASQPLFHKEDPLGFCREVNTNGYGGSSSSNNNTNSSNPPPPPVNLQQQQMTAIININLARASTIINTNITQTSSPTPLSPITKAFPPPLSGVSSQMKRRRLNSDQMMQMFLSDVIIESPHEITGKRLLAPTSTKMTRNVGVDSGITAANPNAGSSSSSSAGNDIIEPEPFSISPVIDLGSFADFFLGTTQEGNNTNPGDNMNTISPPPPPPFGMKQCLPNTSDQAMNPSPLPPADEATKQQANKAKDVNNKTKQGTTNTPKDKSHHIITPSTAAISELTAEIRSQAKKQEQKQKKERATSPSDETQDSSESNQDDKPTTTAADAAGLAKIASVMEASQTSQQNIHDWDKKFGLRRAHSKTMRESCRSRKKVLDFLKGEIKEGKGSVLSELFAGVISSTSEGSTVQEISTSAPTNSDDVMKTEQEEDSSLHSPSPPSMHGDEVNEDDIEMSTTEKVKEDNDGELERMFRRASLDCVENVMGKELSLLQRGRQSSSGHHQIALTRALLIF